MSARLSVLFMLPFTCSECGHHVVRNCVWEMWPGKCARVNMVVADHTATLPEWDQERSPHVLHCCAPHRSVSRSSAIPPRSLSALLADCPAGSPPPPVRHASSRHP